MTMSLTCPECGNKFDIEESQEAKEKQAAVLKDKKKKQKRKHKDCLLSRKNN
ncbi:MAG: hypothetical protein CM1200mP36_03120 [Gammaproteobacteria bacterium]|nr:MAG: hypothetical protein CM1200mP36_03120 [Gammaproteobacteria bacterium]